MSNIVPFKKGTDPHGTGDAFCFQCKHEWIAVAPVGTTQLECPECKTLKGLWRFPFKPPVGTMLRVCDCSNDLFYITPEGHLCTNCGTYQMY